MEQDGWSVTANQISGAYGPAVQAGAIHGDVHFHLADGVAERAAPLEPPEGWADLPELPVEIRFLLRAQVQAGQEMPYRLPGARRPSLATVYVRQDLGSGAEDLASEQPRPAPILG